MKSRLKWILTICWIVLIPDTYAAQRIAVLDFELYDITSMPDTAQEKQRTATIRPLLEQALTRTGAYEIVVIPVGRQAEANAGPGYLFRFHDLAAILGEQYGADWVLVGRHSKPSYLFSYLMGHLVEVKTHDIKAAFAIEVKGNHPSVLQHSVKTLAGNMDKALSEHAPR